MRKRLGFGLLCLAIILALTTPVPRAVLASSAIIYVPDDYSTIQEAVNASSDSDTIIVRDGTYYETITIAKPLTVQSEKGADSTTVAAADPDDYVFRVTADSVTISGFTITGATGEKKAGIYLGDGADGCSVSNNIVSNNYYGIYLDSASNNTLEGNTCHSNSNEGIFLWSACNNNTIDNNTSYSNGGHGGIFLWKSCENNTITNNTCYSNPDHGIKLHESSNNNLLENNRCFENEHEGIFIGFSDNNTIKNNTCNSNTQSGIFLRVSNHNLVTNNRVEFNSHGICLNFANYSNILESNICSNNKDFGISLYLSNSNNTVIENTCNENGLAGIQIFSSNYNELYYNSLSLNRIGIKIEGGEWIPLPEGKSAEWEEFEKMQGIWSKFKEQIESKGIKIEGKNCIGNKINRNNIESNSDWGMEIMGVGTDVDATHNWWGDASGPHHPALHANGKGDPISDHVLFSPWLDAPYPEGKPVTESEAKEKPSQPVVPPEPAPSQVPTPAAPTPGQTPTPSTPEGINWLVIIGIIAGILIIGLFIYYFIVRRARA